MEGVALEVVSGGGGRGDCVCVSVWLGMYYRDSCDFFACIGVGDRFRLDLRYFSGLLLRGDFFLEIEF